MANRPWTPSFFACSGIKNAGHNRIRCKAKEPRAAELWKASQNSTAVPDSCQPETAASTSIRGLRGLLCYYRLLGRKRQNEALHPSAILTILSEGRIYRIDKPCAFQYNIHDPDTAWFTRSAILCAPYDFGHDFGRADIDAYGDWWSVCS